MIMIVTLLAAAAVPHAVPADIRGARTAPPAFVRSAAAALPICDVALRRGRPADFIAEVSRAYSLAPVDVAALNRHCRAYSRVKLQQAQDVTAAIRAARKASLAAAVFDGMKDSRNATPPVRGD